MQSHEEVKAYNRKYYLAHRVEACARSREYSAAHREERRARREEENAQTRARHAAHKEEYRAKRHAYRAANLEKVRGWMHASELKMNYGMSTIDYETLLANQGGVCKICGATDPGRKTARYFIVDHNHKTEKIRGLLCHRCNVMIAYAREDRSILASASLYLQGIT